MNKISELAKLFARYKIYPKNCYTGYSPARVFQKMFLENHYSRDLEAFFSHQDYEPAQRGADLPWWGKKFFTEQASFRVLIIGQDSLTKDAGSVVFFTHLMPIVNTKNKYKEYIDQLKVKKSFQFNSWNKIRTQLIGWNINFDFLYTTDATKVYKKYSWEDRDFDRQKSKKLLEAEIEFCNPNLIIILGSQPLYLLDKTKNYASVVESGIPLFIKDKKCVVAPFLIGNGPTQPNFKKRLEIATSLIKKTVNFSQSI